MEQTKDKLWSDTADKALAALREFASIHFPKEGRRKGFEFVQFAGGGRLLVAGGDGLEPGVYYGYRYSDRKVVTPKDISRDAEPVLSCESILVNYTGDWFLRHNEATFLAGARQFIDF